MLIILVKICWPLSAKVIVDCQWWCDITWCSDLTLVWFDGSKLHDSTVHKCYQLHTHWGDSMVHICHQWHICESDSMVLDFVVLTLIWSSRRCIQKVTYPLWYGARFAICGIVREITCLHIQLDYSVAYVDNDRYSHQGDMVIHACNQGYA